MPLAIIKAALASRKVRTAIAGARGIRNISNITSYEQQNRGGFLSSILNFARGIRGAILGVLNFFSIDFGAAFQWLFNAAAGIARFDWNKTDQEIENLIKQQSITVSSVWGAFVGQGLGWLVGIGVGYGISYTMPVIGGATLAKNVASRLTSEALEELRFGLQAAINQTAKAAIQSRVLRGYMSLRSNLKNTDRETLTRIFGERAADWIRNHWGGESEPDVSFANLYEEAIESIDDDNRRAFVESASDEFFDAFMEAGFLLAYELDSQLAQQRLSKIQNERTIIVQPNRDEHEQYVIEGNTESAKQQTLQLLTSTRQLHNRDVGQLVGNSAPEWYAAHPQRRQGNIMFKSLPGTLWRDEQGNQVKQAQITIPDLRAGTSWRELKQWIKPYQWGRFLGKARLDNGRSLSAYAANPSEARNVIERLANLTTADIVKFNVTEEVQVHPRLRKLPVRMYPAYINLLVRTPSTDLAGRTDLSGQTWDENKARIPLWPDEQPDEFIPII